jgi:hypothetical protein
MFRKWEVRELVYQINFPPFSTRVDKLTKGPITWSIFNPGVELSPVNRVENFNDDFNPGVETLYYTFSASIRGSKKSLYFVFL